MSNICYICSSNNTICNNMKCSICFNGICTDCIDKLKQIKKDNDNIYISYSCPYCRNNINYDILDEKLDKKETFNILKSYLIKNIYKVEQYDILRKRNKELENQIEEMYLEYDNMINNKHNETGIIIAT